MHENLMNYLIPSNFLEMSSPITLSASIATVFSFQEPSHE